MKYKNLLINSTVFFVTAAVLETILHEAGHFVAGWLLGGSPTLFHNSVQFAFTENRETSSIISAAAGPLTSLFLGMFFHYNLNQREETNLGTLFNIYMTAFSYIGFFGYLMVAPFFSYGDTGYILHALSFPTWSIYLVAVFGVFMMYILMASLTPHWVSLMHTETADDVQLRRDFIKNLIFLPLLIGIPIYTLCNLPTPTALSLIAPICSPLAILWVYGLYLKSTPYKIPIDTSETSNQKLGMVWTAFATVVFITNRLLVFGFTLGD
jgi:hypothetical protein